MLGTVFSGESATPSDAVGRSAWLGAGRVDEAELPLILARELGAPKVNLDDFAIPEEIIALIDRDFAVSKRVVPVNRAGASLIIAVAELPDSFTMNALRYRTGLNIEVVLSSPTGLHEALVHYYGVEDT
jgi:type IV pilus assembly protein PilB